MGVCDQRLKYFITEIKILHLFGVFILILGSIFFEKLSVELVWKKKGLK